MTPTNPAIRELWEMTLHRRELSATHPQRAQRTIRPIVPDESGERMICATFSGSDMKYRLERLTDADLRPYSRPGWAIRLVERPAPSLASPLNDLVIYSAGIAEVLVLCWKHDLPVVFPYKKQDGTERNVYGVITWAADDHGQGEVFGLIDRDRKAPRTFKVSNVSTLTVKPDPGQVLPVWADNRWCGGRTSTWGATAKQAAARG
jgi:hypothetical protein